MVKLDPDVEGRLGSDRMSESPQAIRHGNADPSDIGQGEVKTNAGEFNYDANPRAAHAREEGI